MGSEDESAQQSSTMSGMGHSPVARTVPIIQTTVQSATPSPGDPMEVTSPAIATMGPPPARTSPDSSANGTHEQMGGMGEQHQNGNMLGPSSATGTQGGAQQPKVQQTAFIHKLYKCVYATRDHTCEMADKTSVCWRIRAYLISSPGRIRMRASSCRHPTIFQKFCRMLPPFRSWEISHMLTSIVNTSSILIFLPSYGN